MNKECPRCSKKFECMGNESCWCFKVEVENQVLERIRNECGDCLCRECLMSAKTAADKSISKRGDS